MSGECMIPFVCFATVTLKVIDIKVRFPLIILSSLIMAIVIYIGCQVGDMALL